MNTSQKRGSVAIWISDKIDFKANKVLLEIEGYCMMIKGSIYQGDITILNLYIITESQNI